jgi:hypothetical protein
LEDWRIGKGRVEDLRMLWGDLKGRGLEGKEVKVRGNATGKEEL